MEFLIFWGLIMFPLFGLPWLLTIINVINLISKKKIKENLVDFLIIVLGIIFTILLYCYNSYEDYNIQLRINYGQTGGTGFYHAPIASVSMPTIIVLAIIGIISYIIVRIKKLDLPPLAIVLCMSGMVIGIILSIIWMFQISKNLQETLNIYYLLFPINYIVCVIRICIEVIYDYDNIQKERKDYDNKILNLCSKILSDSSTWPGLAIILAIPMLIIIVAILTLCGQRADELIRAFTQTSDWKLSTKISPPPIEYDAHYLCTVSLRGHKEIVKPIRYGIRKNNRIVVNRQLCVANAFEDYIQEKLPKTHHFIRYIYDKYGYPLSKHIKTSKAADITYILMKPLEYFFVVFLYLFDKKPEDRIAVQYLPNKQALMKTIKDSI